MRALWFDNASIRSCNLFSGAMVLGTPRSSKPSASSKQRGGGSIPLAPSIISEMNAVYTNIAATVGVAGHVDHGKTTLVRSLTGIDTDRRAEEKARGLSMESAVARLALPGGRCVALIDVPGHSDFLKNTIRGLNSVDLAVLVVAADDGVMPQTREHLDILKFFNAASGIVVLTKIDLVDEETLEMAELEVHDLLGGTFLHNAPVFRFTAARPELGVDIVKSLDDALNHLPSRKTGASFRLWIDQARTVTGQGTVVSGTVASGKICVNDEIELLPMATRTRARSLQIHACAVDFAVAGQRVGINLHRVPLDAVRRGMSLAAPGTMEKTYLLNTEVRVLPVVATGIKNRQKVKVFLGTAMIVSTMILMSDNRLEPGACGLVQIRLSKPLAARPQDTFVICPLNRNTVIGGGRVLEIPRVKFRAAKNKSVLPLLAALRNNDVEMYMATLFEQTRGCLITAKGLSEKTGLPQSTFESIMASGVQKGELAYLKGRGAIKKNHLTMLAGRFKQIIKEAFIKNPLKKSVGLSEVAEQLDFRVEKSLLQFTADALCKAGTLIRGDGGYRLAQTNVSSEGRLDPLASCILDYMHGAGFAPINPNFFWKQHRDRFSRAKAARLFGYLHGQNKLIRLNDGRYISSQALEEIKHRVARAIAARGFITLGDSRELFGYGRTGGAHILDYLNQIGFTERREDRHFLAPIQKREV